MKLIHSNIKEVTKSFGKREYGLSTGISAIDKPIRGLRPGNLILVAARPSMGKSSIMLDIGLNVGKSEPVLIVSLEMPFDELQERALCNLARLNYHRILSGIFDATDKKKLDKAASILESRQVYVVDGQWVIYPDWYKDRETGQIPENSLTNLIKTTVKELGIKLVLIDHLQFINSEGYRTDNESLRLHKVTESLHFLTTELGIPIILLSQLRRLDPERKKESAIPSMDDIRNSGQVEEDSNIIIIIHRPNYYEKKEEIDLFSNPIEDNVELIIEKNRGGPTGKIKVRFLSYAMSFEDIENPKEGDLLGDL